MQQLTPDQAKAHMGQATFLQSLIMPKGQQTPNQGQGQGQPQEQPKDQSEAKKAPQSQNLEELVKNAVTEAVSGIRNDIKKILADEDQEKMNEEIDQVKTE